MAKITLEYVASGVGNIRFLGLPPDYDRTYINKILDAMNTKIGGHTFSILFNAFTEKNFGERLIPHRNHIDKIHSDSGGLQMMTKGMQINNAAKQQIYDVQGKYSNIGMCFDEIPIISSGNVAITDMSGRFFDHSLIKEKATLTGKNLKEQIHRFHDLGTACTPMLILQGNCVESFQQWTDHCCDAIGNDLKYVYGISSAGSSLGGGELENCVRAFALSHNQYPTDLNSKMIHLLGVGSPSRFIPYGALGEYFDECHISYDSTTHTSNINKGTIATRRGTIAIPVSANGILHKTTDDINKYLLSVSLNPVTPEEVLRCFRGSTRYYAETGKSNIYNDEFMNPLMSIFAYMAYECMVGVGEVVSKGPLYSEFANKKAGFGIYEKLGQCRDKKDFDDFIMTYGRYMKSDKIKSSNEIPMCLEEFC